MSSYKYGDYDVRPSGKQLRSENNSSEKWIAGAIITRWNRSEVLTMPVSWLQLDFETEQDAKLYAASAAKEMIDTGLCKI